MKKPRKPKSTQSTPSTPGPLRTPLPPDINEMRDEELSRGLELHTALTAIARRIAFREIEILEGFNAMGVYFRAFRLLCDSTAKEIADALKVPKETKAFQDKFWLPETEDPCAK